VGTSLTSHNSTKTPSPGTTAFPLATAAPPRSKFSRPATPEFPVAATPVTPEFPGRGTPVTQEFPGRGTPVTPEFPEGKCPGPSVFHQAAEPL
jgi:hypothetical protein